MFNFLNCGKCKVAFDYKKTLTVTKHWMHAIRPTSNVCLFWKFFAKFQFEKYYFRRYKDFSWKGTFMVGVNKRNVLLQNHSQNIILNDHYTYEITYLVDFFFH
jgi:hypothetical protein